LKKEVRVYQSENSPTILVSSSGWVRLMRVRSVRKTK